MTPYPDDRALLLVGETYNTADTYYAVRYLFPDPIIYVDKGDGQSVLACGDFEVPGASAHARAATVRGFQDYGVNDLPRDLPGYRQLAELALRVLREAGVTRAVTTDTIPLTVADHLRASGIDLLCRPDVLIGPRAVKGPDEVAAIEAAQRSTEHAMGAAIDLLAQAEVGPDGLLHDGGTVITSERLRAVIEAYLLEQGCSGEGTITASGPDGAQPHNAGHGPIRAGQSIIMDIFPRHKERRYYADMTRTVSKGAPHPELARMYDLTEQALELALGLIRPGVNGREVFEAVCRHYEDNGYATYLREGRMPEMGFIHGLGHGVGLEIHEAPLLSRRDETLREGQVITVEPGLYHPELGGVRIEDMALVTADGCRNLTDFPKTFVVQAWSTTGTATWAGWGGWAGTSLSRGEWRTRWSARGRPATTPCRCSPATPRAGDTSPWSRKRPPRYGRRRDASTCVPSSSTRPTSSTSPPKTS